MAKLVRLQFEMDEEMLEQLDRLVKTTKAATRKEYVNHALTLFKWVIEEIREGKAVGSVDEEGKVREITMPLLENVRPKVAA